MSTDRLLDRIRAADPAPAATIIDNELFARIVASAGDPRLGMSAGRTPRRRRLRMGTRGLALIAALVTLGAAGGAVGAIQLGAFSHASPKALFEANPAGRFPWRPGQGEILPTVIPQTVHRATTFTVPGVGRFEWWIALSRPKGWLCGAIRQPDGTWADLGVNDKYQVGGPMPGCGTLPWQDVQGFAYNQTDVLSPDGEDWRIAYGYVPVTGHPVEVRDRISGATAPIGDGRYFAIVMPLCKGRACDTSPNKPSPPGYQLQTLNAFGWVLSTNPYDPGM
jgi:hypothetical protein